MTIQTLQPLPALTERQEDVLIVIADWYARWRQSPSASELRAELGLAPRTNLAGYVAPLVESGYLEPVGRYQRRPYRMTPQAVEALTGLLEQRKENRPELRAFIEQFSQG
ncbi:hypothetical protein [Deinococcus sp. SL84]|uniref:hypothetical protein n=1 Tax=Deinococcus sp. SL84 TaxID=2994663 RepID=UPI0022758F97|nr:hypothetical protein [Deinococcus sp. SL84]MCY1704299.1 hypothetical protein [Deinococcus sp. SL84]